jgi:hypothetical protein
MTPEGKIKAKLNARLLEFGPSLYRFMPVQRGMGIATLDYLLCLQGYFVAIETKKDSHSHLTPRQEATARSIENAGGHVWLVYDDASLDSVIASMHLLVKCSP